MYSILCSGSAFTKSLALPDTCRVFTPCYALHLRSQPSYKCDVFSILNYTSAGFRIKNRTQYADKRTFSLRAEKGASLMPSNRSAYAKVKSSISRVWSHLIRSITSLHGRNPDVEAFDVLTFFRASTAPRHSGRVADRCIPGTGKNDVQRRARQQNSKNSIHGYTIRPCPRLPRSCQTLVRQMWSAMKKLSTYTS